MRKKSVACPDNSHHEISDDEKQSLSLYAQRLWDARDNKAGSNVVAWSGTSETFKQRKRMLQIYLGSGVFGDGYMHASLFFNSGEHAAEVFRVCSFYDIWQ